MPPPLRKYIATLLDSNQEVIIKFTVQCNEAAHFLLLKAALAPTLHFCGSLVICPIDHCFSVLDTIFFAPSNRFAGFNRIEGDWDRRSSLDYPFPREREHVGIMVRPASVTHSDMHVIASDLGGQPRHAFVQDGLFRSEKIGQTTIKEERTSGFDLLDDPHMMTLKLPYHKGLLI